MDNAGLGVEQELQVVDESQQMGLAFGVKVVGRAGDDPCSRDRGDNLFQPAERGGGIA